MLISSNALSVIIREKGQPKEVLNYLKESRMKRSETIKRCIGLIMMGAMILSQLTGCRITKLPARDLRELSEANRSGDALDEAQDITKEAELTSPEGAGDAQFNTQDIAREPENTSPEEAGDALDEAQDITKEVENTSPEAGDALDEASPCLEIIMVGDILLHARVVNSAKDPETGKYDFSHIFDPSKELISSADVAIVNQEVIIGGEELGISGYPTFNAPYAIGDALYGAGFDVICHATNHSLDRGKKGLVNCLNFWRTKHPDVLVTGIYDNEEASLPENLAVIEKDGIKIAILNYTYGTNGINPPADMPYAVSMLEEARVTSQLDLAEKEADFTIVCPHWGTEYNLGISSDQEKWAKIFREHGADAVIGTHPHVIEPLIFYGDDPQNISNNHGNEDMPVFYSLGNFVNWTQTKRSGIAKRMVGGMARLKISRKENGEVSIDEYNVIDLVCHLQHGYGKVQVYPLRDYTEELAAQNEIILQDPGFSIDYCKKLCSEVYDTAESCQ